MSQPFSRQNELTQDAKVVGVDIETTPIVNLRVEKIWSISYHCDKTEGCVYWEQGITTEQLSVLFKNAEYNYNLAKNRFNYDILALRSLLAGDTPAVPAFHNAQFDKRILSECLYIPKYFCTQQLAYCLCPPSMLGSTGDEDALRFYSLANLAKLGLCEAKIDFQSDWESFSANMPAYNLQDARSCYQLACSLLSGIDTETFQAYVIDMCAMEMVIQFGGCTIDQDALSEVFLEKEIELKKIRDRLEELVPAICTNEVKLMTRHPKPHQRTTPKRGIYDATDVGKYVIVREKGFKVEAMKVEEFNPNSDNHVACALMYKCGWEPSTYTKRGKPKVDKATLEPLAKQWELADLILKHRKVEKLLSTYLRPYKETDEWNKLYPSFPLCATRTGRLASRSPNFQNVPDDDTRKLIVAPEGWDVVCIDLSQIELRILAWDMYVILGQVDKSAGYLWNAYHAIKDVHSENQAMMGLANREDGRKLAKIGKFLYIYGGRESRLSKSLGISMNEARSIIKNLEGNVPSLPALRSYFIGLAKTNPFIRTLYNHKIAYPKLHGSNKYEVLEAERQVFNARIQGTQADIIKILMWQCRKPMQQYGAVMIAQVHDELVFVCPKGTTKDFCLSLMPLFNNETLLPGLPVMGVPGVGDNWYAAKRDGSKREDAYKEALKNQRQYEFELT